MSISSPAHRTSPVTAQSSSTQRRATSMQDRRSDERSTEPGPANLEPHWSAAIDAATD